jgi:hypothetical protein
VGEDIQSLAHERVRLAQLSSDLPKGVALECDPVHAGQQQAEGDGLGVGVGELLVRQAREQQPPPVEGQLGEDLRGLLAALLPGDGLAHLGAQQLA